MATGLAACARDPRPDHTIYPAVYSLKIPHSDTFRDNRNTTDGFSSPLQATRTFMNRLFKARVREPLLKDEAFCKRFFSASLRQQVATSIAQFNNRTPGKLASFGSRERGGFSLDTIFNAWDFPTSYRVGGSHYTSRTDTDWDEHWRKHTTPEQRAVVDVIYHWGPDTQYMGNERVTSVILVKEKGRWYIDDLYTHNASRNSPGSLHQNLVVE